MKSRSLPYSLVVALAMAPGCSTLLPTKSLASAGGSGVTPQVLGALAQLQAATLGVSNSQSGQNPAAPTSAGSSTGTLSLQSLSYRVADLGSESSLVPSTADAASPAPGTLVGTPEPDATPDLNAAAVGSDDIEVTTDGSTEDIRTDRDGSKEDIHKNADGSSDDLKTFRDGHKEDIKVTANATDDVTTESDGTKREVDDNADGSGEEKVTSASGSLEDDIVAGKPTDTRLGDGGADVDQDFTVKAAADGRTGTYRRQETMDAKGDVSAGEIDYTDDAGRTEKTSFTVDPRSGKVDVGIDEADGIKASLIEDKDAKGDVQAQGTASIGGIPASVAITLDPNGQAEISATVGSQTVTITENADGSGSGTVQTTSGSPVATLTFDGTKKGVLTEKSGISVPIQL